MPHIPLPARQTLKVFRVNPRHVWQDNFVKSLASQSKKPLGSRNYFTLET